MKPATIDEIIVRIETALSLRQLRAKHQRQHELLKQRHERSMRLQLEKERLIAFIVHDLKNPVSSIGLLAQVVMRSINLPQGIRESGAQIQMETRRLNRMISSLLDVSKAAEGELSPKRTVVDVRALVDDVVTELEVSAQERDVTIRTLFEVPSILADEELLRRVVANLIENATRHAPRGTEVTVTTTGAVGSTELRVADRGVGVPAEMRERVFDPFVQVAGDGRSCAGGGHGLGLTFCKVAALAHGGRIWVDDTATGATFCVMFPDA